MKVSGTMVTKREWEQLLKTIRRHYKIQKKIQCYFIAKNTNLILYHKQPEPKEAKTGKI